MSETKEIDKTAVIPLTYRTSQNVEMQGTPVRLTRHQVVFEVYAPFTPLRVSEALSEFRIFSGIRRVYSGRAIVTSLVNTGTVTVCEATLEDGWRDVDTDGSITEAQFRAEFTEFMRTSQAIFTVLPEFKLIVADMQVVLQDIRFWLDQVESSILSRPSDDQEQRERDALEGLKDTILPVLGTLFERFEAACRKIDIDLQPVHRAYVKRQLHPLVLCAPFMYRAFRKPLGYAGDYEMVNMMVRDPFEGPSIFAKLLNAFFLRTPPVVAHRNRLEYLTNLLTEESARVLRSGRGPKVFNVGCGPAKEVQDFITNSVLSENASFALLDFNDETLTHARTALQEAIRKAHRRTQMLLVRKAVAQLLKEVAKTSSTLLTPDYDLVYCAGLFDYLPQQICRQLAGIFYQLLAPGGLMVVTNVEQSNPSRNWMEYAVDWHLVYRDSRQMAKLVPEAAPSDSFRILSEATGVNLFLEVRKPAYA